MRDLICVLSGPPLESVPGPILDKARELCPDGAELIGVIDGPHGLTINYRQGEGVYELSSGAGSEPVRLAWPDES